MKKKLLTAEQWTELRPKVAAALQSHWDQLPEFRLWRAAKAVRAGQAVEAGDRVFIHRKLMELYDHEHVQRSRMSKNARTATVADHLTRSLKITRERGLQILGEREKDIGALLQAIKRLRRNRVSRKRRK